MDSTGKVRRTAVILNPPFFGGERMMERLPFESLKDLIAIAFSEVKVEDDVVRESGVAFSPGSRERAERARDILFRDLAQTPGQATLAAIHELGATPNSPLRPDTVESQCLKRAAEDLYGTAWLPDEAFQLEQHGERAPRTLEDIRELGVARLDDIARDLRHRDFSLGSAINRFQNEIEVQRWCGDQLRSRQGQAYSAEREPHVAEEKAPDLRLRAKSTDASVPIEIKDTASDWSVADLEKGLVAHCAVST